MMSRTLLALILFAIVLVVGAQTAAAQLGMRMDPEERTDHMLRELTDRIELSDDQAESLRPILLEEAEQMRELFETMGRNNREALRATTGALREETNARVSQFLSEEQMTGFLEWRESQRGRGRPGQRMQ